MKAIEQYSTKYSTGIVLKILASTSVKAYFDTVATDAVQLDKNQRKKLLSILT